MFLSAPIPNLDKPNFKNLLNDPIFQEYLQFACNWLDDYLNTNPYLSTSDRLISHTIRERFNLSSYLE